MKTTVGVYENHEEAVDAAKQLKDAGFKLKSVSIIGVRNGLETDDTITEEKKITTLAASELGIGAAIGSTLGVLTGVGLFAIPGVGLLFGAGAIVGALAGLDVGLVGGGIVAALSIGGMKEHHHKQYDEHLKEGRYILILSGSEEEAIHAKDILHEHDTHIALDTH